MKKTALVFLLLLAAAAATSANEIAFVDTYDQALKAAGEKSQNIIITFYTDW
jgi:Skp family chaperone for outer membrane proteins